MIGHFKKEPYTFLSNFYPCEVVYDGVKYSSVEHAYQSAKSDNKTWKEICSDPQFSAGKIKRDSKKVQIVEGWDKKKLSVMLECLKQKFSDQNPSLKEKLLATRHEYVQEGNYHGDSFWGVDLNTGEGQNYLGRLIMKVRTDLSGIKYKKVGIVGSRSLTLNPDLIYRYIPETATHIISGGCPLGVDNTAEYIVDNYKTKITHKSFVRVIHYADWTAQGKAAGFIRNQYIADDSDYLLAFHDGQSKGTMDTVNKMKKLNKPCKVITIKIPVEI